MAEPTVESRELSCTPGIRVASFVYSAKRDARVIEEVYARPRIIIVEAGVLECRSEGRSATLLPGSILLADAGHSYEYTYDPRWAERCVSFAYDPAVFADVLRGLGLPSMRFRSLSLVPNARLATLAQLLRRGDPRHSAEESAYALAAEVLETRSGGAASAGAPTHVERRRAIEACRLIESRSSEPLSLTTLAAELGLSPFHFLRGFKRALGFTPHQYLVQTRLRRAAALTIHTPKPIVEIAQAAGFSDLANFNRSFRQAIGCSPRRLRQEGFDALRAPGPAGDRKIRKVSLRASR